MRRENLIKADIEVNSEKLYQSKRDDLDSNYVTAYYYAVMKNDRIIIQNNRIII